MHKRHTHRSLLTSAILFLTVITGCAANPGRTAETEVQLDVRYEDSWSLTGLSVEVEWDSSDDPLLLEFPLAPEVTFAVPDGWGAGEALQIVVFGLRGDERYAHGSTSVTPIANTVVTGEVVLTRLPCGAWCSLGATRCVGDGVQICEQRDDDACMEWSSSLACPAAAPFCSLGQCDTSCVDECAAGETRCDGPAGAQTCGEGDSDTCLDWLPSLACDAGSTCSFGTCAASCRDECALDERGCFGSGTTLCGDLNLDGCLEWSPSLPCVAGELCSAGACEPAGSCVDECTVATCAGLNLQQCGNYDLDPCLELSSGTSCVPTDPCLEGRCEPSGCETAVKVCMEPAPAECIDENTLRTYDTVGECASDGTCAYRQTDRACANCPDCDACAGVVCDTPPSTCFAPVGSCTDGACTYPLMDGADCNDGNPCSVRDMCTGGTCAGSPMACDTPPAAACIDANQLREFSGPGMCAAGACTYPASDSVCAEGCSGGACAGSTCTPGPWTAETVTPTGNLVGRNSSIAVDFAGRIHISYQDTTNGFLKYATRAIGGGAWTRQTVDSSGNVDRATSLAVDGSGQIHISYYDDSAEELKYATRPLGGAWTTETVDTAGNVGMYSSIFVEPSGRIHIGYRNRALARLDLMYASRLPGEAWVVEVAASAGDVGTYVSLKVDAAGAVHMTHYNATDIDLMYTWRAPGGAWASEIVDPLVRAQGTSLGIDAVGQVHVAYYTSGTGMDLRYAKRSSAGSWSRETVDATGNVGGYPSLALSPDGAVHVSYFDGTNGDLKFISLPVGGAWSAAEVLDATGRVGLYTSLALDTTGPHQLLRRFEYESQVRHSLLSVGLKPFPVLEDRLHRKLVT